jgi:cytochrome c peroxidase
LSADGCRDIEVIDAAPDLATVSADEQARVALGERLFSDTGLSGDGTVACASCHAIADGGDDGRSVSIGIAEQTGRRNAPTVLNTAFKALPEARRGDPLARRAQRRSGPLRGHRQRR